VRSGSSTVYLDGMKFVLLASFCILFKVTDSELSLILKPVRLVYSQPKWFFHYKLIFTGASRVNLLPRRIELKWGGKSEQFDTARHLLRVVTNGASSSGVMWTDSPSQWRLFHQRRLFAWNSAFLSKVNVITGSEIVLKLVIIHYM
jgi:hypothetical protein